MKHSLLSIFMLLVLTQSQAQLLESLSAAINDPQKSVQAIHHYPKSVRDGECHWVEVTGITVSGNTITMVEQWKDWRGARAKTTLKAELVNNVATGHWESGFSSGSWSFNFAANAGNWNKTKSIFDKFKTWQKVEFTIVNNKAVKDGFLACSAH